MIRKVPLPPVISTFKPARFLNPIQSYRLSSEELTVSPLIFHRHSLPVFKRDSGIRIGDLASNKKKCG
jgi:hypothetical protein